MARFTVRVELHNANITVDYPILHKAMEDQGFSRMILDSDSNVWYHLPTAEYNLVDGSIDNRETVMTKAQIAAKETGNTYSILVTKSETRLWYGLEPVDWTTQSAPKP